ncbi:cell wall-binding repeat-containing protein [Peptacetobacter sp.]|uniref:cell wall-binding repeat-containing protein n=1 Tax=Peptacetobacter sp. TaxID=2991975 RepID=UPI002E770FA4|nr:cell wall-binding repeat-containing protein [Peptacetobacter sp.]MEE0450527.1 cell wall-binding repeat-containing protein [Peptacetobacter sp.]
MNKNRNKIAAMMMVAAITVSSVAMPVEAITSNSGRNIQVERSKEIQLKSDEITDIAITEEAFPDEEFRNKVIQIAEQVNVDNPILSADKIRNTTELDLYDSNIENLEGIENFKNLKILDCSANNLTSLDLSGNILIEDLNCGGNKISQINLSGCSNLIKFTSGYNGFDSIDLSDCVSLEELELVENNLKSLDLSNNMNLKILYYGVIDEPNLLSSIDFGNINSLETITINRSWIESLDFKNMSNLKELTITSSPIKELDLSGCTSLKEAYIYYCGRLESLNCGDSINLTKLDCSANRTLKNLDVSNNINLKELTVAYSGIEYLNLKNQATLEKVYIDGSKVSKIDLNPNVSNSVIDGELAKPDGGNGGGTTKPDQKPEEKPDEKPNKKHEKIIGSDRYETAAKIADKMGSYNTVILVNSDKSMADGLSAASLSGKKNAPILLVKQDKIPKVTMDRINKASNVYIIGGENAISKNVEKQLKESGKKINRISGKDRYDTSKKIAELLGGYDKAFIVNGAKGEADAISVSAVAAKYGAPILLTNGKTSIHDKKSGVKYYAIGGTAVIDNKLEEKYSAERMAGSDRYDTNSSVIDKFYRKSEKVYFAKGDTLIDALTASALAKDNGIVLVSKNRNHSELDGKDTVQVGGMNFEIDFE